MQAAELVPSNFEGPQELFPFVEPVEAVEILGFLFRVAVEPGFCGFPETPFGSYIPSTSAFPYLRAGSSPFVPWPVDGAFLNVADEEADEPVGILTGADVPGPFEVPREEVADGCFRSVDGGLVFAVDGPAYDADITGDDVLETRAGEAEDTVLFATDLFFGALDAGPDGCGLREGCIPLESVG